MKQLIVILACIFMTACVYTQNTREDQSDGLDKQKTVQIEVGKTDKQWVISNLGVPDKIQSEKDGTEIYEYISENRVKSERTFIFLFSLKSEKVTDKQTFSIHFKNNIVESVSTRDNNS